MPAPASVHILPREDGRIVLLNGSLGPLPKDMVPSALQTLPPYKHGALNFDRGHFCFTIGTDRTNCPVALRRSPAQIVAANRMFPFGDTGCKVASPPDYADFQGPMDTAWFTNYMPTTGERPDIGLITDASASYMLGNTPKGMIAGAHAAGSCPMHFRDEKTGKPIDLFQYPMANTYMDGGQGSPHLLFGPPDPTDGYCRPYPMTPQQAHYTEMSYLAHLATLDMGFLEDLGYSATFTTGLCDTTISSKLGFVVPYGELRGLAWAFRNLFMVHVATKDAEAAGKLPAACHSSSYWKKLLDQALAYWSKYMSDQSAQAFRLIGGANRFGPWQFDYMLMSLAFGVLTGHSDWAPFYLWALKNAIDRTSGKSGYPVGWGGAYYLNTCPWAKRTDGTYDQGAFDTSKPFNWYDSFLFQQNDPNGKMPTAAEIAALKADPFNGGKAIAGAEYLMTTRAVIVTAQYLDELGLVDVKIAHPDLDLCFTNIDRMVRANGSMNPRVSVVLDVSKVPDTIPPLPPVTPPPDQPPTEEPPVSQPGTDPLAPLKAAADSLVALVPQIQAAVDNLEAQIVALKAAAASGTPIPAADITAIVARLNGVKTGLAAAVTDAATPG